MRRTVWAFALMIVAGCGGGDSQDLGAPAPDAGSDALSDAVDQSSEPASEAAPEATPESAQDVATDQVVPDVGDDHADASADQDAVGDMGVDAMPEVETGPDVEIDQYGGVDAVEPSPELQPEAGPDAIDGGADAGPEPHEETGPDAADGGPDVDVDAAPDAAPDAVEAGPIPCPGFANMTLLAGGFCIDRTEVTVAAYRACVTSTACNAPAWQPASSNYVQAGHELHPMNWIDWGEASAYCLAQGKRLCGHVGGGPSSAAEAYVAGANEWYTACSSSGAHIYPYGDAYQAGKCNSSGSTEPVGNRVGCQPASVSYAGLMDMSGNVWEWEDSCFLSGTTMMCSTRGGGLSGTANDLRCDFRQDRAKTWAGLNTGFRCCLY